MPLKPQIVSPERLIDKHDKNCHIAPKMTRQERRDETIRDLLPALDIFLELLNKLVYAKTWVMGYQGCWAAPSNNSIGQKNCHYKKGVHKPPKLLALYSFFA